MPNLVSASDQTLYRYYVILNGIEKPYRDVSEIDFELAVLYNWSGRQAILPKSWRVDTNNTLTRHLLIAYYLLNFFFFFEFENIKWTQQHWAFFFFMLLKRQAISVYITCLTWSKQTRWPKTKPWFIKITISISTKYVL